MLFQVWFVFLKETPVKWGKMMQNPMFVGRISRLEDAASIFVGMTVFTKGCLQKREAFQTWDMKNPLRISWTSPPKCNSKTPSKSSIFTAPKGEEMDHLPAMVGFQGRFFVAVKLPVKMVGSESLLAMPSRYRNLVPGALPPESTNGWNLKLEVWFQMSFLFISGMFRFYVLFSTMAKQS